MVISNPVKKRRQTQKQSRSIVFIPVIFIQNMVTPLIKEKLLRNNSNSLLSPQLSKASQIFELLFLSFFQNLFFFASLAAIFRIQKKVFLSFFRFFIISNLRTINTSTRNIFFIEFNQIFIQIVQHIYRYM